MTFFIRCTSDTILWRTFALHNFKLGDLLVLYLKPIRVTDMSNQNCWFLSGEFWQTVRHYRITKDNVIKLPIGDIIFTILD